MAITLKLVSAGGEVDLNTLLSAPIGTFALAGMTGIGLPGAASQWFEGAGDGATYRGSRTLPREIDLPLRVDGRDPEDTLARLSVIARILDPMHAPARLVWSSENGTWETAVVRTGGGDWPFNQGSSNATDRVSFTLSLRAGDPFWTSTQSSQFVVRAGDPGDEPFLPELARLYVTSSSAMGSRRVENPGDAPAFPVWEVHGPGTQFTAVSASGEVLQWSGTLGAGEQLTFDTRSGTVVDNTGANRYDGLSSAPRFWSIAPGESTVSVVLSGATLGSLVTARWKARRWLIF